MSYLGLDIGTSGCKAVVYGDEGQRLALAKREYDVQFTDNGGAELDSEEVIKKCFEVIQECSGQVEAQSIIGMGVSSQGEAFTAIGAKGDLLCNAMISSDIRSEPYVERWKKKFDSEKLYQITGHTPHPMFTIFKLLWLQDNRPEVWAKAEKFLCFEDLFHYKLGLAPAIGYSLAGCTMLFDVRNHQWSQEIMSTVGISKSQLARPMASGSMVGKLDKEMSRRLRFADGAFVVAGGHDQTCGALGAGITEAGMAMYATGTVECLTSVFSKPIFTKALFRNNLCTYNHTVKDLYATIAFSLTGGNILKWFRDEFGKQEIDAAKKSGKDAYELLLNSAQKKPSNLMVLPYFTPSGTPHFDTKTKGAILGLRLTTSRGEIIKALLEGVAFEMRLNMEILEQSGYQIDELRAIGGGAKSAIWSQLKADITGKNIIVLNVIEAGCMGVAMLACAANTGESIQKLAAEWVRPLSTLSPQADNKTWYDKQFKVYQKLYDTIKEIDI